MPMNHERPVSPIDGWHIVDDFITNDAVADATVGALDWQIATLGNASTIALQTQTPGGVLKDTTNATADGDGEVYRLFTDGLVIKGGGNGGIACRVRLADQIASNNFRIGLDDSVNTTAPGSGIWINCDGGVLSAECYSNDHGDTTTMAAAGVSTLTTGTTMVVATWHDLRVEWSGTNGQGGPRNIEFYVDGELAASGIATIDDDEEVEPKIIHWQDSGGALAVELDIDYYEAWNFISRD